ncbi:MAG: cation:proton antiporter [Erysipelotrichales bacterium]|nr:cation:proton antiporter [Erysipelotrichales bacterium]
MNFVLFLGILLILGLMSTRIVKIFKLPNVTGYLVVGLIAALLCIIIDTTSNQTNFAQELTQLNSFISSIALGFIALSIGEEFKVSKIKEYGKGIITITFFQAFAAVILVDVALIGLCLLLKLDLSIAICLGAIATATAPAATLMVIHQYKAKGPLVDILLPVVAFDDAIGLIVFAISVAISKVIATGSPITFTSIVLIPLIEIVGSLLIGFVLGAIMHIVIKFFKSRNNHAITIIAFTLLGVGACEALNTIKINGEFLEFSNLLCCMMIGAAFINMAKDYEKPIAYRDFDLIDHWTPFLFMLFFVLSGAHLVTSAKEILANNNISIMLPVVCIFAVYIIMRSLGKYLGSFVSCKITKRQKTITKFLGITLLPQAGVAIGMANQISGMEAFMENNIGNIIVTVVLCATLVYELIGPLLTKWSLNKAGEIPDSNGVYPYENSISIEKK